MIINGADNIIGMINIENIITTPKAYLEMTTIGSDVRQSSSANAHKPNEMIPDAITAVRSHMVQIDINIVSITIVVFCLTVQRYKLSSNKTNNCHSF